MRTMIQLSICVLAVAACGGTQRSTAQYRADTQQLLTSRTSQVEACYARALATDAAAGGTVTVKFTVEKGTGKLAQATVDPARSTAPEPVVLCVLESLAGLVLQPADRHDGKATFAYELRPQT